MLVDNFSAHYTTYEPQNIHLEFIAPNMTSFVQPMDAGIIRCFKAHYRRGFSSRAIELDNLNEHDIYQINLLEAMILAREAWKSVDNATLKNCWKHTGILPEYIYLFLCLSITDYSQKYRFDGGRSTFRRRCMDNSLRVRVIRYDSSGG
jgi:hypothetical protein